MGTRCADHVTPLYPQKLALNSLTGGGRSVGIVRSRTKATEFFLYERCSWDKDCQRVWRCSGHFCRVSHCVKFEFLPRLKSLTWLSKFQSRSWPPTPSLLPKKRYKIVLSIPVLPYMTSEFSVRFFGWQCYIFQVLSQNLNSDLMFFWPCIIV